MSISAKIAVSVMRGIKKTGLVKGPDPDFDTELRRAKEYNRKHPYREPRDRKADYRTVWVAGYPCLVIRSEKAARKAILFLHGAADDFILPKNSEDMAARTKGYQEFHLIPGAGHAESILTEPEMYQEYVTAFLQQVLG